LLPQRLAGIEHRSHPREQARTFAQQLDHPRLETGDANGADLEAEGLERSADFVVDRHALFQQRSAVAQQQAELLALRGLDVDGGEPPDPLAWAIARASLRSVLTAMAAVAPFIRRVSMQIAGSPAARSPGPA
jgi:hypothetical protein